MSDVHTKQQRSYNMSQIRGRDTKPEILLRKALWRKGFRYSLYSRRLAGKPDIVMSKYKIAIFIDGCFWHRCPDHFKEPRNNKDFWNKKIASNLERDEKNNLLLKNEGWTVLRFWEHEISRKTDNVVRKIIQVAERRDLRKKKS
jgi:DNA mismatch endonuclease, patch repair protein